MPDNHAILITGILKDIKIKNLRAISRSVLDYLDTLTSLPLNLKKIRDEASMVLRIGGERKRDAKQESKNATRNKLVS